MRGKSCMKRYISVWLAIVLLICAVPGCGQSAARGRGGVKIFFALNQMDTFRQTLVDGAAVAAGSSSAALTESCGLPPRHNISVPPSSERQPMTANAIIKQLFFNENLLLSKKILFYIFFINIVKALRIIFWTNNRRMSLKVNRSNTSDSADAGTGRLCSQSALQRQWSR